MTFHYLLQNSQFSSLGQAIKTPWVRTVLWTSQLIRPTRNSFLKWSTILQTKLSMGTVSTTGSRSLLIMAKVLNVFSTLMRAKAMSRTRSTTLSWLQTISRVFLSRNRVRSTLRLDNPWSRDWETAAGMRKKSLRRVYRRLQLSRSSSYILLWVTDIDLLSHCLINKTWVKWRRKKVKAKCSKSLPRRSSLDSVSKLNIHHIIRASLILKIRRLPGRFCA